MRSILWLGLFILGGIGSDLRAQYVQYQYIAPGTTPAGDYLRGLGIAADGLGSYNWKTAIGESIQTDTAIRADQYVREVLRQERVQFANHERAKQARFNAKFNAIRERIRERPEMRDIITGNALNDVMTQLNDPRISDSSFRLAPARVSIEEIRRIPFALSEKGVTFSMRQLTFKGKGNWEVAFQDPSFALERKAYDRALDNALEHMIGQEMPEAVINTYQAAVADLETKVKGKPWPDGDKRRSEANDRLRAMRHITEVMKLKGTQGALAELDSYGGTTVNDLRLFMNRHKLRFGVADSGEERELYARLYESLVGVRELVLDTGKGPGQ